MEPNFETAFKTSKSLDQTSTLKQISESEPKSISNENPLSEQMFPPKQESTIEDELTLEQKSIPEPQLDQQVNQHPKTVLMIENSKLK